MMVFGIELVLLLFLIFLNGKLTKGLRKYVLVIFNVMWLGGLAFSNIGAYSIFRPSDTTNIMFVISIIIFNIVYIFASNQKKSAFNNRITQVDNKSFCLTPLIIMNILLLLFCIPYARTAIKIIQNSGMSYLRYLVYIQSPEYISNTMISVLFQWIIQPFLQFVLLLAASQINNIKENKPLWILAIIDLLVDAILFGGGRRTVMTFIIEVVLFYVLTNRIGLSKTLKVNKKKIAFVALIIAVGYLSLSLTASRLTRISVGESIYQYYVGPFVYFDKITSAGTVFPVTNSLGYGVYTFSFILTPIYLVLSVLTKSQYSSPDTVINTVLNKQVNIGAHSVHNAHATALVFFYSDFGALGYWLGMILFAFILGKFTQKYKQGGRSLILAVYFASFAFYSAQTYPFTGVIQYVVIAYAFLFIKESIR